MITKQAKELKRMIIMYRKLRESGTFYDGDGTNVLHFIKWCSERIKTLIQAYKEEILFLEDFKKHLFGYNADTARSYKMKIRIDLLKNSIKEMEKVL